MDLNRIKNNQFCIREKGIELELDQSQLEELLQKGAEFLKEIAREQKMGTQISLTYEDEYDDEIWHTFEVPYKWLYTYCKKNQIILDFIDHPNNNFYDGIIEDVYKKAKKDRVASKIESFGK